MRLRLAGWALLVAGCGSSVAATPDAGDATRVDADSSTVLPDVAPPRPDVIDVVNPVCTASETAAGRCDGNTVVICQDGFVVRSACTGSQRCAGPASGVTARCLSPLTTIVTVSGRVTYARRPLTEMGLGAAAQDIGAGFTVQLLDATGATRDSAVSDPMGVYSIRAMATVGETMSVRVLASRNDTEYTYAVQSLTGTDYSARSATFDVATTVTRDMAIGEENNAGAFAIASTIMRGLDFVRANLPSRAPRLRVRWNRSSTTPGGTSYFTRAQNVIFLLGGPMDTDEFDEPVILHEFGHFVEQNFSRTSSPGGSHDGTPTDPRLAWGEGWGTWFGCVANNNGLYLDSMGAGIRVNRDLESLPLTRNFMGSPTEPMTQDVGEVLVAGSLWHMSNMGASRAMQVSRQLAVSTTWFTRMSRPDRGVAGIDFVDFLDGYLCLHGDGDAAMIRDYVVTQRQFPYDFNSSSVCP